MEGITFKPTNPEKCILAVSIPLTKETFFNDLSEGSGKDFARNVIRTFSPNYVEFREDPRELIFIEKYNPYVELILKTITALEKMGCQVQIETTVKGFEDLVSAGYEAITLIAHHRSLYFSPEDFKDVSAVANFFRCPAIGLIREFKNLIFKHNDACYNAMIENVDVFLAHYLLPTLNDIVDSMELWHKFPGIENVPGAGIDSNRRQFINRRIIDKMFSGLVTPGDQIEFADGMVQYKKVVDSIPSQHKAIIDLSVCKSVFLGEEIKIQRRGCVILTNQDTTPLWMRIKAYFWTMELIRKKKINYLDAHISARKKTLKQEEL
jgi:hypothetical protein